MTSKQTYRITMTNLPGVYGRRRPAVTTIIQGETMQQQQQPAPLALRQRRPSSRDLLASSTPRPPVYIADPRGTRIIGACNYSMVHRRRDGDKVDHVTRTKHSLRRVNTTLVNSLHAVPRYWSGVSWWACLSVCLSVFLSTSTSHELHAQTASILCRFVSAVFLISLLVYATGSFCVKHWLIAVWYVSDLQVLCLLYKINK